MKEQEFYVGYLPEAPKGIAAGIRGVIAFLMVLAVCGAVLFALSQQTFAPAIFEYGKESELEGILESAPAPALLVTRPGANAEQSQYSRYLLVAAGKRGANQRIAPLTGKKVRLRGTLIYRNGATMIELGNAPIQEIAQTARTSDTSIRFGPAELTGEIVDSKCNFGVMNPGAGKVHKDCAIRCISGGVPPVFLSKGPDGSDLVLILTGPEGKPFPISQFLRHVAQPVRLRGTLVKSEDTLFFQADPASLSPLN